MIASLTSRRSKNRVAPRITDGTPSIGQRALDHRGLHVDAVEHRDGLGRRTRRRSPRAIASAIAARLGAVVRVLRSPSAPAPTARPATACRSSAPGAALHDAVRGIHDRRRRTVVLLEPDDRRIRRARSRSPAGSRASRRRTCRWSGSRRRRRTRRRARPARARAAPAGAARRPGIRRPRRTGTARAPAGRRAAPTRSCPR